MDGAMLPLDSVTVSKKATSTSWIPDGVNPVDLISTPITRSAGVSFYSELSRLLSIAPHEAQVRV